MSTQTSVERALAENVEAVPVRLPNPYDVALALAVVKTKPAELTVREYIMSLLPHCTGQKRWPKHFDRASYWRAEHERVSSALNAAINDTDNLRRENEILKMKAFDSAASKPNFKRRRIVGHGVDTDVDDDDCFAAPKSPSWDTYPGQTSKTVQQFIHSTCELEESDAPGSSVLSSLFQLHLQAQATDDFDIARYAFHLARVASNAPELVEQAQKYCLTPLKTDETDKLMSLVHTVVAKLLQGLVKLASRSQHGRHLGQVIHAYTLMFSVMLDQLQQATMPEAEELSTRGKSRGASKPRTILKGNQSRTVLIKEIPGKAVVSRCLCGIISLLDPKIDSHKDLFEALAFVIIDRLGDRLFTMSFGHRRGSSIEEELRRSFNLSDADINVGNSSDETVLFLEENEFTEAKADAPYLIHLLRHLVAVSPHFMGSANRGKSRKTRFKQANSRYLNKGVLVDVAMEKLQRTLVNCTFGSEGVKDDDPLMQCLKPLPQLPAIALPRVREVEVHEWFKEEVWKLIGWDILGKEDGEA